MDTPSFVQVRSVHYAIAGSLAALILAVTAPVAKATTADETPSLVVKYTDLNVNTPQGARVLYSRLRAAATDVCGGDADLRDPDVYLEFLRCYWRAMDSAVQKVDEASITALYAQAKQHFPCAQLIHSEMSRSPGFRGCHPVSADSRR